MSIATAQQEVPAGAGAAGAVPKVHLGYLDSLRALAAIHIVLLHALTQVDPKGDTLPGYARWFHNYCCYGHEVVGLFIALSGFCLMLPVVKGDGTLRGGALYFFKKRARRILPTYYLALGFCLLCIGTFLGQKTGTQWDLTFPVTKKDLIAHLLMLQDMFRYTNNKIDYSLWTVSVEWRIYLVFPLLVLAWRRFGALPTTAAALVTGYLLLAALRPTPVFTLTNGVTPQYLGVFALGMLGAGITFSRDGVLAWLRTGVPWLAAALGTSLLLIFVAHAPLVHGQPLPISLRDFFVGLWAMSLLIAAGYRADTGLHRALSWKPLAFIGTFAYSIYVIHAPLLQILWLYVLRPLTLTPDGRFLAVFLLVIPLVVGLSYLFFLVGERPFLKRPVVLNTK